MVLIEQINAMLSFFEKHPAMLHGWNKTTEGRGLSRKYWCDCAGILNAVSPDCPTKTPTEWRMYYNELKSKTLKKVRAKRCFPAGKQGKPIILTSYQRRLYKLLVAYPSSNINLFKLKTEEEQLNNSLDGSNTSDQQISAQETNGQSYSLGETSVTFDDDSGDDPLQSVKEENRWTAYDDTNTRDSDIVEASMESRTEAPMNSYDASRRDGPREDERSIERAEELHKLQVAERIWLLKTMRERHATARLERELMQLRRDRAQLDLDRARRQDLAHTM